VSRLRTFARTTTKRSARSSSPMSACSTRWATRTRTIARLRKILFGPKTEKTAAVTGRPLPEGVRDAEASPVTASKGDGNGNTEGQGDSPTSCQAGGHGRNGANTYTGAEKIEVAHPVRFSRATPARPAKRDGLQTQRPGVLVRLVGQTPVGAKVYYLQKLRCNLCRQGFYGDSPEAAGEEKYDPTVASMIALLKYGSGCLSIASRGCKGRWHSLASLDAMGPCPRLGRARRAGLRGTRAASRPRRRSV